MSFSGVDQSFDRKGDSNTAQETIMTPPTFERVALDKINFTLSPISTRSKFTKRDYNNIFFTRRHTIVKHGEYIDPIAKYGTSGTVMTI